MRNWEDMNIWERANARKQLDIDTTNMLEIAERILNHPTSIEEYRTIILEILQREQQIATEEAKLREEIRVLPSSQIHKRIRPRVLKLQQDINETNEKLEEFIEELSIILKISDRLKARREEYKKYGRSSNIFSNLKQIVESFEKANAAVTEYLQKIGHFKKEAVTLIRKYKKLDRRINKLAKKLPRRSGGGPVITRYSPRHSPK
jgi:chromosome segregation ATPase